MKLIRKILALTGILCLMLSATALALPRAYEQVGADYQRLLGGWNAAYFSNPDIICAVAKLHINAKGDYVRLPQAVKNFAVVDAGGSEAYLIVPRIKDTTFTLYKLDSAAGEAKDSQKRLAKVKGDTLVLFCNEKQLAAEVSIEMRVQNHDTRIVTYTPAVSQDGSLLVPEKQQAFIIDVSKNLKTDGKIAYRKDKINNLINRYLKK